MAFDPLHKWLGIPESEQPPHHYRLLGIPLFEDDPEVIDAAAYKHLAYLHEMTNGPNAEEAEELSNLIATARICLCHEGKKAKYDRKLRREMGSESANPASSAIVALSKPMATPSANSQPGHPAAHPHSTQNSGWMLRHGEGDKHGPYPFENLVEAARLGRINASTLVQHPIVTGGEWLQALSVARIAAACPMSSVDRSEAVANATPFAIDDGFSAAAVSFEPVEAKPTVTVSEPQRAKKFSVRTRRRANPSNRSWIRTTIGAAMPAVLLCGLIGAIHQSPGLRAALARVLLGPSEQEPEPQQTIVERVIIDNRKLPKPQTEQLKPASGSTAVDPAVPAEPKPSTPQPVDDVAVEKELPPTPNSPEQPVNLLPVDEMRNLRLDLSKPRWSATLEGASDDDQFFVVSLDKTTTRIEMTPLSGELSFDGVTTIKFIGMNGLGMDLSLVHTGDPAKITLAGRVLFSGEDFRLITVMKTWNDVGRSLSSVTDAVNFATSRRVALLAVINGSGEIRVDRLNQAKNELVQIDLNLPRLIKQRDALQTKWDGLKSIVRRIEELNDKGELVVCVRRFVEESDSNQ